MDLNLTLIHNIQDELEKLAQIAGNKLYDKEIVFDKIKKIVNNLNELNTVKKEAFKKYKENKKDLYQNLNENITTTNETLKHINNYYKWLDKSIKYASTGQKPSLKFLQQGELYETKQSLISKRFPKSIDNKLMTDVLNDYTHIYFMQKRKEWLNKSHILFKLQILISTLIKLLISAVSGFLLEKLLKLFFIGIPDFAITIVVAITIYFMIDKKLDKKFNEFLWHQIRNQILELYKQFDIYVTHINILIESIKNDYKNQLTN